MTPTFIRPLCHHLAKRRSDSSIIHPFNFGRGSFRPDSTGLGAVGTEVRCRNRGRGRATYRIPLEKSWTVNKFNVESERRFSFTKITRRIVDRARLEVSDTGGTFESTDRSHSGFDPLRWIQHLARGWTLPIPGATSSSPLFGATLLSPPLLPRPFVTFTGNFKWSRNNCSLISIHRLLFIKTHSRVPSAILPLRTSRTRSSHPPACSGGLPSKRVYGARLKFRRGLKVT